MAGEPEGEGPMTGVVTRLAEEFMMGPEDLADIFTTYFLETAQMIRDCRSALVSGDVPALVRLGHSIKGASANLRLEQVFRCALELEDAARGGNLAVIAPSLDRLADEVAIAETEVSNFYRKVKTT